MEGHDARHGAIPHIHTQKRYDKVQSIAPEFPAPAPKTSLKNGSIVYPERGWLPEMPCLDSVKLALWESGRLLKTLRCEDGYPYPLIGEQTCHWQAQLRQRQGTDSASGGSSSCLNGQSLLRIKAVINTATIHTAPHAFCG